MGFKINKIIKRIQQAERELTVGEIDKPYTLISTGEKMYYAVTYHEGKSSGMNRTFHTKDLAMVYYNKMYGAFMEFKSFDEMHEVFSEDLRK